MKFRLTPVCAFYILFQVNGAMGAERCPERTATHAGSTQIGDPGPPKAWSMVAKLEATCELEAVHEFKMDRVNLRRMIVFKNCAYSLRLIDERRLKENRFGNRNYGEMMSANPQFAADPFHWSGERGCEYDLAAANLGKAALVRWNLLIGDGGAAADLLLLHVAE